MITAQPRSGRKFEEPKLSQIVSFRQSVGSHKYYVARLMEQLENFETIKPSFAE